MNLIEEILKSRGYGTKAAREAFLSPDYMAEKHDPFLLPDMQKAVDRLVVAKEKNERVVVYGDYDIDGLTASTVLLDSLTNFGINTSVYIPNRFVEGYGLSSTALEIIADGGGQLVVTVDCGSLSHKEIEHANSLGLDVIVTDHHSVAETMPEAVAVINPKRTDHTYPFIDLAGVGVAFKLVQALQTRLEGLPEGQEKWLLDLVALGTVCDVVELKGENRANVFWGLKVMQQTRRPGIQLLMAVSGVEPKTLSARALGFGLGPRLNASGRLKTAQIALDLLTATDRKQALALAEELDAMNVERRAEQDRIFVAASEQALTYADDSVLVVSHAEWSHGIIGIVAAKLLEKYHKPTFVLQELDDGTAKGSARSFGDFSAVEGIRATEKLLVRGGGHKLAAGVTIKTCLLYTSPSPRDRTRSRMPSSA
jgi:single-stranded-DNA-specific exonuclease